MQARSTLLVALLLVAAMTVGACRDASGPNENAPVVADDAVAPGDEATDDNESAESADDQAEPDDSGVGDGDEAAQDGAGADEDAADEGDEPADADAGGEAAGGGGPTVVARGEPEATATPDPATDPMAPVPSEALPGVVVPSGAELVDAGPATDTEDAWADYVISGTDLDALSDWFQEHMAAAGWGEARESDGSLIFLHESDLSRRYADEGLRRSASVHFDTFETDEDDAIGFTLVVEDPAS